MTCELCLKGSRTYINCTCTHCLSVVHITHLPPYKMSLVTCIERDITAEPVTSSGFYSAQASAAL